MPQPVTALILNSGAVVDFLFRFPEGATARSLRALIRKLKSRRLGTKEIFAEIYDKGLWGKSQNPDHRYFSGPGSHEESVVTPYIDAVGDFLRSFPEARNVVDLGCGDFSVGSSLRPFCSGYIAVDVVPQVIEYNKSRYGHLDVAFMVLDAIADPLPEGDVVFVRQVLQHLSNNQIMRVVQKLVQAYSFLILTEHLPDVDSFQPNLDKPPGPDIRLRLGSGVVLTEKPFDMRPLEERILCEARQFSGVIRTTLYKLK